MPVLDTICSICNDPIQVEYKDDEEKPNGEGFCSDCVMQAIKEKKERHDKEKKNKKQPDGLLN